MRKSGFVEVNCDSSTQSHPVREPCQFETCQHVPGKRRIPERVECTRSCPLSLVVRRLRYTAFNWPETEVSSICKKMGRVGRQPDDAQSLNSADTVLNCSCVVDPAVVHCKVNH